MDDSSKPYTAIGCFLQGDRESNEVFRPYIWDDRGFFDLFEARFTGKRYGPDLDLILFMFLIRGPLSLPGERKTFRVGRYSPRGRSIRVEVPFEKHDLIEWTDQRRKEFVVSHVTEAIALLTKRLTKKLKFDFVALRADVQTAAGGYLAQP